MVYCNHVSFAAFFLHFHDRLRTCKTKCSSVHHLSTKAFLWPLDLGHASHSFVFTRAIFSLPACTLTVQLYKAATLATMNWSQHFTLQSQLLFRCENLAGYWLKMRLFTFNFSTKCSLVVVKNNPLVIRSQ